MKLGLKRKRLYGQTEKSCLLFKAKGEVRCKYQTNIFLSDLCVDVNSGVVYNPPSLGFKDGGWYMSRIQYRLNCSEFNCFRVCLNQHSDQPKQS